MLTSIILTCLCIIASNAAAWWIMRWADIQPASREFVAGILFSPAVIFAVVVMAAIHFACLAKARIVKCWRAWR